MTSPIADIHHDVEMPIRPFVTKHVIGVPAGSTVQEAARRMVEFDVSSLVVVGDDEEVIGFLTLSDLKRKVLAEGRRPDVAVDEVMDREPATIDIGTRVREALELMSTRRIKHLLVEERGRVAGILTFRDLIDVERHSLETHISRE